jgi:hypothetical protein
VDEDKTSYLSVSEFGGLLDRLDRLRYTVAIQYIKRCTHTIIYQTAVPSLGLVAFQCNNYIIFSSIVGLDSDPATFHPTTPLLNLPLHSSPSRSLSNCNGKESTKMNSLPTYTLSPRQKTSLCQTYKAPS